MAYFILAPANWIITLLLIAWLLKSRKWKKRCIITAVILFLLFSNKALFIGVMKLWEPAPVELSTKYQTGILLGGVNWMQAGNNGYITHAGDRFFQALKLYKKGAITKILISAGGENPTQREAAFLQQQLLAVGVPVTAILIEERSTSTYENAAFCKRIIDSVKLQSPFVLITSAFHIPRATKVFQKAGIAVVPFPCDYEYSNRKLHFTVYFFPDIEVLDKWTALLKEWVGIAVYKLEGKI